jgi:branched-chain amino acid transport system permease protein
MNVLRNTLQFALVVAVVAAIVTVSGLLTSFDRLMVIEDAISLSRTLMIGLLLGAGYFTARRVRHLGLPIAALHGVLGAGAAGLAVGLLVALQQSVDLRFVFRNLGPLLGGAAVFGRETLDSGLLALALASALAGLIGSVAVFLRLKILEILITSLGLTIVIGILEVRLGDTIALPDSLLILLTFAAGYFSVLALQRERLPARLLIGAGVGGLIGAVVIVLVGQFGLERGGMLRGPGSLPIVLELADARPLTFALVTAAIGAAGAFLAVAPVQLHNSGWYLAVALLALGILNWQNAMTWLGAGMTFTLLSATYALLPEVSRRAYQRHADRPPHEARGTTPIYALLAMAVLAAVPVFGGLNISRVFDYVLLYIIMGIGLNVMVGYAGLLNLGYVAGFAIGAYTLGLLTTPSMITCGGRSPDEIDTLGLVIADACTGIMTFWEAWPVAILVSAAIGMLLGVPVLRLRGDYLAIVTLGFGEIVGTLIGSDLLEPLLGGTIGIENIPNPVLSFSGLDQNWAFPVSSAQNYFYLFLACVVVTAFAIVRLSRARLGRAWRAMRADEDVAEAMGINLVWTKLVAFGISFGVAGMAGAIFAAFLRGTSPNSFDLLVSINVLSLIIIGGMGSISGVVMGALVLVGLPEMLRELVEFRLLAFGLLLVTVMLLRPEGLLPPVPPRLAEQAHNHRQSASPETAT